MKDEPAKTTPVHPSSFILHPSAGGILSVALSRPPIPGRTGRRHGRGWWTLSITVPCGARTFLPRFRGGDRPSGPRKTNYTAFAVPLS